MAKQNNNEAYKLLELSDHSESNVEFDLPEVITTPRKKKIRRKFRRTRSNSMTAQTACTCNLKVVSVWIAAILLTTWIITLTWLAIVLHNEIQRLDSTVRGVVASSQGVPDALQKCHTISKNLQQNQTLISSQIVSLRLQLDNFTKELTDMQTGFNKIQEKLNNVPDYLNVPQQLKDVSGSIANLGSQIKDITTTVASLKDSKDKLDIMSKMLLKNVTNLRQSVLNLQNVSQEPVAVNSENSAEIESMLKIIDGIKNNVTTINSTLSHSMLWISDDLKKSNIKIDANSNVGQNMSARVATLEGICGKTSSDQITLSTNIKSLTDEFTTLTSKVQSHASQILDVQTQMRQLSQNSSELSLAIEALTHSYSDNTKTTYTQASVDSTALHERDLVHAALTTNNNSNNTNPSSTLAQIMTDIPTENTATTMAKEPQPTGKPAILRT